MKFRISVHVLVEGEKTHNPSHQFTQSWSCNETPSISRRSVRIIYLWSSLTSSMPIERPWIKNFLSYVAVNLCAIRNRRQHERVENERFQQQKKRARVVLWSLSKFLCPYVLNTLKELVVNNSSTLVSLRISTLCAMILRRLDFYHN